MNSCCPWCKKVVGALRILLGIAMLYFGITKLSASPDMIQAIGGAGHAMGLTFLSVTTRFWIATIGELLAGTMLVLGACARTGALITLAVMIFAINAMGWTALPVIVGIVALVIVMKGAGSRTIITCPCCSKTWSMNCCGIDNNTCCKENDGRSKKCCEDHTPDVQG